MVMEESMSVSISLSVQKRVRKGIVGDSDPKESRSSRSQKDCVAVEDLSRGDEGPGSKGDGESS
jgi:hypothetical protein